MKDSEVPSTACSCTRRSSNLAVDLRLKLDHAAAIVRAIKSYEARWAPR